MRVTRRVNREVVTGVNEADTRDRLTALGTELDTGTPQALRELIALEAVRWQKLIPHLGIVGN